MKIVEKILKKLHEDHKQLRIVLGTIMLYGFLSIIMVIYTFAHIQITSVSGLLYIIIGTYFFWMPSLLLIILTYFLLTKVYPYEPKK